MAVLARTQDVDEKRKNDFPLIRERILEASVSKDWETARREWGYQQVISEDDDDFVDQCELCNQVGLRVNHHIVNPGTNRSFRVGSTCIRRFLILRGTTSSEETSELLKRAVEEKAALKRLHGLIGKVLDRPTYDELAQFRAAAEKTLGTLNNTEIPAEKWNHFTKLLLGPTPVARAVHQLRIVLFNPGKVPTRTPRRRGPTDQELAWARTVRPKKSRAKTTLVRSKGERPGENL